MSNIQTNDELKRYVNTDHAIHYVKEIFKNCIDVDPALMVEVRKIGMYHMLDGTQQPAEQSTAAQLLQFDQNDWQPGLAQWVAKQVQLAAPIGIGAFLAPGLLNDRRANDQSVVMLATVCADFDTGNPKEQLDQLCARLGMRPTLTCTSGGTTKDGHAKLHAHWRLDEPCSEPWKVAYVREQLALLYGADASFKRIPQIIRIPGALYDKQGKWGTTLIIEYNDHDTSLLAWEEALEIDWYNLKQESIHNTEARGKKTKEQKAERVHALQTEIVEEGRVADTRWDRFSEYAGHQIRQARFQHQTIEEALTSVKIWVRDKMVPAWEMDRVEAEFKALLQRDRVNHEDVWSDHGKPPITFGAQPIPASAPVPGQMSATPPPPEAHQAPDIATEKPWMWSFDAPLLYAGEAPPERHLIENFLVYGSAAALVADGGVGKTYVALELALRAAAGPDYVFNGKINEFLGFLVKEKMNVIVFTVEDGQHDIHRRICAIDVDGSLREAARDHCMIIPVQEQIVDGLTLVERDAKGNFGPSRAWKALQGHIEQAISRNPSRPLLVIIDTYSATHHGDENSATGTNEWFRSAGLLRKFNATLLITHHVKKADPKMEIRTANDMKAAVRGSSAFLNSLRIVYGIWEMPNGDAVLKELPREEKGSRLFNMGILKNNTGTDWSARSDPRYPDPMITLRRLGSGRLIFDDIIHLKRIELTAGKGERMEKARAQLRAAIIHDVRWYAQQGWPLSERNLTKDKEQYLPPRIRDMARDKEIEPMVKKLLGDGSIKQISIKGKGVSTVLDVPDGPYAMGMQTERRPDMPMMQWSHFKYDEEHEEYVALENVQHIMDI